MRGGGLEPEEGREMIEECHCQFCAVWRRVAQIGPRGPILNLRLCQRGRSELTLGLKFVYVVTLGIGPEADYT